MTESAYLVGLRLTGKKVVVVGGGTVAQRRLPLLIASGADVHVISRSATRSVEAMTGITLQLREYRDGDLDGAWYAIAATDDPRVNQAVVAEAERRRIFCVRADVAVAGTAVTPASFSYAGLSVGVLAGGEHRRSAAIRSAIREALQTGVITPEGPVGSDAVQGGVALIGGGPGDPELITVRGRRLLAQADVVVADRLAPPELLAELPPHVEVIDAAKIPYGRAMAQDAINDVMIERARAGSFVVRLKGGDPFVFARGYEEVLACADAGIPGHRRPGCDERHRSARIGGRPGHASGGKSRIRGGQRASPTRSSRIVSELGCTGRIDRHNCFADGGRTYRTFRRGPAEGRTTSGYAGAGGSARDDGGATHFAGHPGRHARKDSCRRYPTSRDHRDRRGGGFRGLNGS